MKSPCRKQFSGCTSFCMFRCQRQEFGPGNNGRTLCGDPLLWTLFQSPAEVSPPSTDMILSSFR